MEKKTIIAALIGLILCFVIIPAITVGSADFLAVNTTYQTTILGCNATYIITIENVGDETDTFDLAVINIDNASLAVLSQYSITINKGQSADITLNVTDSNTEGPYYVNVTATSQTDALTDVVNTITAVVED